MFEQSVVEARGLAARPWTLAVSLTGQVALVSVAILLPLMHPEMLQKVSMWIPVVSPPPAPVPRPVHTEGVTRAVTIRRLLSTNELFAPRRVPDQIVTLVDAPDALAAGPVTMAADGIQGGTGSVYGSQVIADIAARGQVMPPRPPAPEVKPIAKPHAATPAQIKQGGDVQASLLIYGPKPVYPALARQARIQGTVHLAAIIGRDGNVIDLRARDGHPLLVGAAIDAVKRWRYSPTLLNGDPVEVVTEIAVTFTLQ